MRHRRGMLDGRREYHGNDREGRIENYRTRTRYPEQTSYRDRGRRDMNHQFQRNRCSTDNSSRRLDKPLLVSQESRELSDRIDGANNGAHGDTNTESLRMYLRNKYCDNTARNNENAKTETWGCENLQMDGCDLQQGGQDIRGYQRTTGYRHPVLQNEHIEHSMSRPGTDRTSNRQNQSEQYPSRIPATHEPYPQVHGYTENNYVPLKCGLDDSLSTLDPRRAKHDVSSRSGNNTSMEPPFIHNHDYQESQHTRLEVCPNIAREFRFSEHPYLKEVYRDTIRERPHESKSLHDQVYCRRQSSDFERPSVFEPVTVPSSFVKESYYGNESRINPCRSNLFGSQHPVVHETLQPTNPALFTENSLPVMRRDIPPCPGGIRPITGNSEMLPLYRREQFGIDSEIFPNLGEIRPCGFQKVPDLRMQQCVRSNELFQPVCVTEAENSLLRPIKDSNAHFIQRSEHNTQGQERISLPLDTSLRDCRPSLTTTANKDVALIPLPFLPPPPPPPPPPSEKNVLQSQASLLPGISLCPPASKTVVTKAVPSANKAVLSTTKATKTVSSETIPSVKVCARSKPNSESLADNEVSSTSNDLDQVSSSLAEKVTPETTNPNVLQKSDFSPEMQKENVKHVIRKEGTFVPTDLAKQQQDATIKKCSKQKVALLNGVKSEAPGCIDSFAVGDYVKKLRNSLSIANLQKQYDNHKDKTCYTSDKKTDTSIVSTTNTNNIAGHNQRASAQGQQFECYAPVANENNNFHRDNRPVPSNMTNRKHEDYSFHRPWQIDHWGNRHMRKVDSDFNHYNPPYNPRREHWASGYEYMRRPYNRPDRKRLSGLGINTYSARVEPIGRRHSTLGYFRPWEKQNANWMRQNSREDSNYDIFNKTSKFLNDDLFPGGAFWRDDFEVTGKRLQLNNDVRNLEHNRDIKVSCNSGTDLAPSEYVGRSDAQKHSSKSTNIAEKNRTVPTIQETMEEVFKERRKARECAESTDNSVKEKCPSKKYQFQIDFQKRSTENVQGNYRKRKCDLQETVSKGTDFEKDSDTCMDESNDKFAEKRRKRYNHGQSYSEIVAVKGKTNQRNSSRKGCYGKNSSTKDRHEGTKTDTVKLKNVKSIQDKVLSKSLTSSESSDKSPKTEVGNSSTSRFDDNEKVSSKMQLSKIAKPDISLENKLLKSLTKGRKAAAKGLDSYKIPHVKIIENHLSKTSGKLIIAPARKKIDEIISDEHFGRKTDCSNKKRVELPKNEVSIRQKKKVKRLNAEKGERKSKLRGDRAFEKQNVVELRSLHPKLRHKFTPSGVEVKKKKLKIVVEKCDFNSKRVKTTPSEIAKKDSMKNKQPKQNESSKKVGYEYERSKQNSSLVTRGKFILSTPNTLQVKERKPSKTSEGLGKKESDGNVLEEKTNLDKAFSSAKKDLLYRALAVNALKRDKTKPLVEKKVRTRKSLITTDLAKKELSILKETLETKSITDQVDENNNRAVTNDEMESVCKSSALNLDQPTTLYQPQRTAIGNYATQCLFGPIVSSTFFKAPGKARVIRNSKETFRGYSKCEKDFRLNVVFAKDFKVNNTKEDIKSVISGVNETSDKTKSKPKMLPCSDIRSVNYTESHCEFIPGRESLETDGQVFLPTSHCSFLTDSDVKRDDGALMQPFESKGKTQMMNDMCDDQEKSLELSRNEILQLKPVTLPFNGKPSSPKQKDVFSLSDQFEMHKRYLQCKQELAGFSGTVSDMKTNLAPVLPVLPVFPVTTPPSVKTSVECQTGSYSDNANNENINTDLNDATGEHATKTTNNRIFTEHNRRPSVLNNLREERQYEPTNEDFEMYRKYQIQRIMSGDERTVDPQHAGTTNSPECPGWTSPLDKPAFESPNVLREPDKTDVVQGIGGNINEQVHIAGGFTAPRPSLTENTSVSPHTCDTTVALLEKNISDEEFIQNVENRDVLSQRSSCDILNLEQELQDTSKDMFEEIVTDILKDDYLISSIPITPPDITREVTYSFGGVVNEKLTEDQLTNGSKVDNMSPELPLLSPQCHKPEEPGTKNSKQTKDMIEQRGAFKSARTPIHLGQTRRPRYEKRFPKPLPRAKPQKTQTEKELYQAAERFLGDFDHKNKRSCCKGNSELLINPVTGKMEPLKTENKKVKELVRSITKAERVKYPENRQAESKDCKDSVDSQFELVCSSLNKTKKVADDLKSADSLNVVTCKQLTTKKIICKSKVQKLRNRAKAEAVTKKGKHAKKNSKSRRSCTVVNILKKKIPSIRLKTVVQRGVLNKNVTKKWQKVRSESGHLQTRLKRKKENKKNVDLKSNQGVVKVKSESTSGETIKNKDIMHKVRPYISMQTCKKCEFSCDSTDTLIRHCRLKHKLYCYRCGKKFKDKKAYQYHVSQSHNAERCCELCGSVFNHKGNYDRHLKSKCHLENLAILKLGEKDTKVNADDTESVVISDGEEASMEIVDVHKTKGKKNLDGGKQKLKSLKSPKLYSSSQKNRKRKQKDAENTDLSEGEVEVKKTNCLQYCNICRQYYKRLKDHFKTSKHRRMLLRCQRDGRRRNISQEVTHTLTIDDTDIETPMHTDDDTVGEDDVESIQSSTSSCRSVVLVSDHDSHYGFEEDSNLVEDTKPWICDEKGELSAETGLNTDDSYLSCSEEPIDRTRCEVGKVRDSISSYRSYANEGSDTRINVESDTLPVGLDSADVGTDALPRKMPVVVSTCQGKCSPTLLVKNIAADIVCKMKGGDLRENIFDSLSSQQKCLMAQRAVCGGFGNNAIEETQSHDKYNQDMGTEKILKNGCSATSQKLPSKKHNRRVSGRQWESIEGDSEKVVIVELLEDKEDSMDIDTVPEHGEANETVDVTEEDDYQVTENPSSPGELTDN